MIEASPQVLWLSGLFCCLVIISALYCVLVSRNLIRILIGVELLTKAVTLLLVGAGHSAGRGELVQALIISLILVEVVVIAVAAGLVIAGFRRTSEVSLANMSTQKG